MYENQVDRSYGEKIENFNDIYDLHLLIKKAGFIEELDSVKYNYINRILYSRYYSSNYGIIDVQLNGQNGLIDIEIPKGIILEGSFDFYVHYYHSGSAKNALNWESDPRINIHQSQTPPQQLIQNQQYQTWPNQTPSPLLPPIQSYFSYPNPTIDIDCLLDNSTPKYYLNLETHIHDKDSFILSLAVYISHKTDIPIGTIIVLTLGLWSGMTSKRYQVSYTDGRTVSVGLYVALEQNSGAGKSPALEMLLEPMSNMIKLKISEIKSCIEIHEGILDKLNESLAGCTAKKDKADNKENIERSKNFIKKLNKNLNRLQYMMPITNTTPEALDAMLTATNGFFFAASAEHGLFNSVLGLRHGSKHNNNDLLLNSREGGYVNTNRVGRKSYSGQTRGAITSFAQEGGIRTLLSASTNTGLAERFLMVSEPSYIGFRDRITEKENGDHILGKYAKKCAFFQKYINGDDALNHDSLITLKFTNDGWRHIANFEQELEYKMRPGCELSHPILQRVVGKTKMQVMGIAANLYLLNAENPPANAFDDPFIPYEFVVMAINIFKELIFGVRNYCERKGLISDVAQLTAVFNVFVGKGENASYTDQELKKRLQQVKPFKDIEEPRKAIQRALDYFEQHHVLIKDGNGRYFKNPVRLNPNRR
ncbi:DUF3987 domain-containing protein [Methylotuvimicrobium buryatense]|uniref:DUF3987 domain-containing protein n=1 Tax=Methylotuvimicrobium buryatense TaxID=95641 RepID=A0A4V1IK47_METBY|nr:DUF3987 domain-containing protein [Methylotuvimicrobium buryatense]QCW83645.1 DUF3987 domain-containing protein [Methylotuvimicrobium buryatense]